MVVALILRGRQIWGDEARLSSRTAKARGEAWKRMGLNLTLTPKVGDQCSASYE